MISKPFFYLHKLQEGMGPFWKEVAAGKISALYMLCSPTNKNVIESLQLDGENQQKLEFFNGLSATLEIKINDVWPDFYASAQAVTFFHAVLLK